MFLYRYLFIPMPSCRRRLITKYQLKQKLSTHVEKLQQLLPEAPGRQQGVQVTEKSTRQEQSKAEDIGERLEVQFREPLLDSVAL